MVQLAGCEAALDGRGRPHCASDAGADIVDINMGCPARHVTNGQSGSALMRDLDHALTLIDATVAAVSVPVDAEDAARLGSIGRSMRRSLPAAPRTQACGLITVHGRTRCQFYKGEADWAAVRAVKRCGFDPGRGQRRYRDIRGCRCGAERFGR